MIDRKDFSHKDMDQWLAGNNVTEIECLVPDLTGVARGKILRAKSLRPSEPCVCQSKCLV